MDDRQTNPRIKIDQKTEIRPGNYIAEKMTIGRNQAACQ